MSPIPVHSRTYYVIADIASDNPDGKRFSNTFFFGDAAASPLTHDQAADKIKEVLDDFYGDAHTPGTVPIAGWLSARVDIANSQYKVYDLSVAAPRTPEVRAFKTMTVNTGQAPNEVAAVLSYRSDAGGAGGGTLDKTKRGRLYIGPLSHTTWETNTTLDDVQFIASFQNSLLGGAEWLAGNPDPDIVWLQYSRKMDDLDFVSGGFVDRNYDTQRRRGVRSAGRTAWSA